MVEVESPELSGSEIEAFLCFPLLDTYYFRVTRRASLMKTAAADCKKLEPSEERPKTLGISHKYVIQKNVFPLKRLQTQKRTLLLQVGTTKALADKKWPQK